ncbi:hypothetical protein CEH05_06185 [Halobacillus halophilus]|uniref:Cell wall-active antibiotics response LiaF-like C-terminal domain-containing protein n=1 Tax=Halobacillus halophilus (strain ATCC 35676 / DSM 2266 / JCM 20832 / KCTC 3685 / LMG 17431 / NBRC 102448 / NCIMB 2269) TaxID=866895 RepID=I0JKA4_HALH3|nr:cell wall-active antibiotics response protein LiaF [Halobacillus halophilus]ASF38720.1 hypothetical protein CEH05_06185 [Halobacillus halophilus]CCG44573.1 conserved hypothetical protein [Halobacillus halophilus DSM 2266]
MEEIENNSSQDEKRVIQLRKRAANILLATGLVVIGAILLLANLGIISLEIEFSWSTIYPVLLAGIGLKLWGDSLLKQGGSWTLGSFLTVFGVLLIMDRFEVISFQFADVLRLWPLLFIYIGFSIFLGGQKTKKFQFDTNGADSYHQPSLGKKRKSTKMLIGDHSYNDENWKVEPMDLWNGIGDYKFDFTRAFIPDGDTPIIVRGWIGDVKMIIPNNVPFRVEARIKTGDIKVAGQTADGFRREIVYETEDYQLADRRLSLWIDFNVGSIKVERV